MAIQNAEFKLVKNKTWENRIASENIKLYKEYKTYGTVWRSNAMKLENARYGRQFSKSEEEVLLKFRQAPLPISVSTAICDTADAMMVSSKPTVYVAPIMYPHAPEKEHISKKVAQLYTHLIQKAWFDSLGNLQFDRVVNDYTNVGHGLMYVNPRNEFGEFGVEFSHLSWRYFFPDPSTTDPLYRGADNLIYGMGVSKDWAFRFIKGIENDLSKEQFKEYWVDGADVTERMTTEEDDNFGRSGLLKDMVMFISRFTLEEEVVYCVIPKAQDINYEGTEAGYRTYTQLTPDLIKLKNEGRIAIETKKKMYLTEYTSIGNLGYKVTYPISQYNIIPLIYDHRETPYPYSRMWYLYPLQRALNRFLMSSMINMSLLNSTRILAEENSIINEKDWIMNASNPGVILNYRLQIPGISKPPIVIEPKPMSEAYLHMPKYLTYMMEYISGIYSTMMGDPSQAPDVFSTVATLQSAGSLKIKRRMAHADATLSVAGQVAGEFYQHYAPLNGFTTHHVPNKDEEIIQYNQVDMKTETDSAGVKKNTVFIQPDSDLRIGFKKVRFTSQASSGYEAATETALLTHLATQLGIPQLASVIVKRVNIDDADKVAESIDENLKLAGENEQLKKQAVELDRAGKIRMKQIEQLSVNLKAAQVKGNLDKELEKFKSNPQKYIEDSFAEQETKQ